PTGDAGRSGRAALKKATCAPIPGLAVPRVCDAYGCSAERCRTRGLQVRGEQAPVARLAGGRLHARRPAGMPGRSIPCTSRRMKTEYSEAKSKSGEANPLRWSNLFHLTVGIFNLLAGCLVAFLLTREVEAVGLGLLPALGIAATLLVLGLAQVARAWRDEKFRFRPDDIGSFAVPGKHIHGGNSNESAHLVDVLSNGVQPSDTPDNALL